MRFFAAASALAALSYAAAQNSSLTIQVGSTASAPGGIFQFSPSTVTAPNGTTITFVFSGIPGNHSVTQSSFANPCEPLAGGFDSGWVFLTAKPAVLPTWNLTVTNDAKPLWFFCKQLLPSPHCNAGMVGGINVPTNGSNTFPNFQNAAKAATSAAPGQSVGALVGQGASASVAPGPIGSGVTAFGVPSATAPPSGAASSGAGTGSASGGTTTPTHTAGALAIGANIFGLLSGIALVAMMI